ncbi:hypothetical protein FACS1894176_05540 [Bacteroidia bacterium]|nr:hypothetical protein FACS1894176_05540 [Bacteroidia bacterium]
MNNKQFKYNLPAGWAIAHLGDLACFINGKSFKSKDWRNVGIPIIRIQNLNNKFAPYNYISEDFFVEEFHKIKKGDLLFAWSGTPGTSFGAHIWQNQGAYLNQHIYKVIPFNGINKKYLFYALNYLVNDFIRDSKGTAGLSHITKKDLEKTMCPVAPYTIQLQVVEKIEELFSELDKHSQNLAIAKQKANITIVSILKNAFNNDMWKKTTMGKLCELNYGKSLPKKSRMNGKIPVYGSNGIVGHHDTSITTTPAIIIGRKGSAGKLEYSEIPCYPIDTTYYIEETADYNLKFLYYQLQIKNLPLLNKATTIPGLNRQNLYDLELLIPDSIEEQKLIANEIEEQLSNIDELIKNIEHELQKSEYTYQKILNQAFQGKLTKQVVNGDSAEELLKKIKLEKEKYIEQQSEFSKNRPKIKVMEKEKFTVIQLLEQSKSPVLAEELWKNSIYDAKNIDEFYAELKGLVEEGAIEELPREGKKSYLKLVQNENR